MKLSEFLVAAVVLSALALLVGCQSHPVTVVRQRQPVATPKPVAPAVQKVGRAIDKAVLSSSRAVDTLTPDMPAPHAEAVKATQADIALAQTEVLAAQSQAMGYDAEVALLVADRNAAAEDANAVDLARASTGATKPKTTAEKISGWIVGLTVAAALGGLVLAGYFAWRLQFLKMGMALAGAGGAIVGGLALSWVALHWLWFVALGLVVIAALAIYRWHDLIAVKVRKWLERKSLDEDLATLAATAKAAAEKAAAALKAKSAEPPETKP